MAILEVLKYPNPTLRKISQEVKNFDEDLHRLLDNMYETMNSKNGVGLAAIQVGVQKRVLLINIPRDDNEQYQEDLLEIINPVFLKKEGSLKWNEGCLSIPEFYEEIDRFEKITLAYQDRFGNKKILQGEGLLSIAIQHEIDHLNGILFVDKLPILKRKKFEKELKKIQKESK
ncbi:peptide deformylase [Helicobacter sp. 12S02232-10]|uniref:peptide deformylase n=1 Tax=Helicobacter sp. 12S02232-10 TaxID=1476197 RepID=UPI000BA782CE|nr:peptide deformylase [Helicobacter sp. 12S02232-10]PAF48657.1 peptide deformylase [Helicobacter sp. 12S02232-10]